MRRICPHCGIEFWIRDEKLGGPSPWARIKCPVCEGIAIAKIRRGELELPTFRKKGMTLASVAAPAPSHPEVQPPEPAVVLPIRVPAPLPPPLLSSNHARPMKEACVEPPPFCPAPAAETETKAKIDPEGGDLLDLKDTPPKRPVHSRLPQALTTLAERWVTFGMAGILLYELSTGALNFHREKTQKAELLANPPADLWIGSHPRWAPPSALSPPEPVDTIAASQSAPQSPSPQSPSPQSPSPQSPSLIPFKKEKVSGPVNRSPAVLSEEKAKNDPSGRAWVRVKASRVALRAGPGLEFRKWSVGHEPLRLLVKGEALGWIEVETLSLRGSSPALAQTAWVRADLVKNDGLSRGEAR